MKMLLALFFCCALTTIQATKFELNDSIRYVLAHLKASDLPASLLASLNANQGRAAGDSSHWCCVNEQPITTVTETKIDYATRVVVTKTKVGYVDCGFMGLMKCSQYTTATRSEHYSFIQTFQVPNLAACASHEMKCCSGYILVAENCHAFTELMANQELFQFLANLGLLGVGK